METIEQLRADLERARVAALSAPNAEAARVDNETVAAIQRKIAELEVPIYVHAQVAELDFQLMFERREKERAMAIADDRAWLIEKALGESIAGMSMVKIGHKLTLMRDQRNELMERILDAKTLDDLETIQRIVRNMKAREHK